LGRLGLLKADFKAGVEFGDAGVAELHQSRDEVWGLFGSIPDLCIPWESAERHFEEHRRPSADRETGLLFKGIETCTVT